MRTFHLVLLCPLVLTACAGYERSMGKQCAGEVSTSYNAQFAAPKSNLIGSKVEFCAGGAKPGKHDVEIKSSYGDAFVGLGVYGTYETNDHGPMHWDGACDDMERRQDRDTNVGVALTSKSFSEYKLCYFDASKTKIALLKLSDNEACPDGSTEQTEPVDDCTKL